MNPVFFITKTFHINTYHFHIAQTLSIWILYVVCQSKYYNLKLHSVAPPDTWMDICPYKLSWVLEKQWFQVLVTSVLIVCLKFRW